MVDGWARNVCKDCSDEEGMFFSRAVGLSSQQVSAAQQLVAMGDAAILQLKQEVPDQFWLKVVQRFESANTDARMALVHSRTPPEYGWLSYKKFLSHHGALRLRPQEVPPGLQPPPLNEWGMYDPGNWVYKEVFFACWPLAAQELGYSNEGTVGDLVEALLGWVWFQGHVLPAPAMRVVEALERACLAVYLRVQTPGA